MAVFLANLSQNMLGITLSPFAVGALNDLLTPAYGKAGLAAGIGISAVGYLAATIAFWRVNHHVRVDLARS
jgi:hypothetical protein